MSRFVLTVFVALAIFSATAFSQSHECPENAHYEECVSPCIPTCLDEHPTCTEQCRPGCTCDENYISSNFGVCVHRSVC